MSYYKVKEIYPWLFSIYDPLEVYCYLAVGQDKALLFDTTHGIGNLPEVISTITSKPVITVLGHGHADHGNGAYQFDEAYLHEEDFELSLLHSSPGFRGNPTAVLAERDIEPPEGFDAKAFIKSGTGNLKKLEIGKVFELGGLSMEVICMRGHTHGSIGLLAREKQILLVSDAASSHVWMFLDESTPINEYINTLEKVYELDFHTFFPGHSNAPHSKSEFLKYIKAARGASIEKSVPYLRSDFGELEPFLYREDGVEIAINARTLGNAE